MSRDTKDDARGGEEGAEEEVGCEEDCPDGGDEELRRGERLGLGRLERGRTMRMRSRYELFG